MPDLQIYLRSFFEISGLLQLYEFIVPQLKYALPVDPDIFPINLFEMLLYVFIFLAVFGVVSAYMLSIVAAKFAVKIDPKVEKVRDVLPGANCGACGYAGCQGYAEAVTVKADVSPNLCAPGRNAVANAIALITGKKADARDPIFARIMCQGGWNNSVKRFKYEGVQDCRAAVLAGGGDKSCIYGCLGYGTCAKVCPFGAISMNENHLPIVDMGKCTGCRKCETACPKKVIEVLPALKAVIVACHSKDKGVDTRKYCQSGCIACGKCVKVCPFDAPSVSNNLSRINLDKCRVCGLCVKSCPTNAIADFILQRPKAFITEKCIGCQSCRKVCPVNAASGESKKMHSIDSNKCIGCGICTAKCPVQAIDGTFNAIEVFAASAKKKRAA